MKMTRVLLAAYLIVPALAVLAGDDPAIAFRKTTITDKFWSEGVAIGDFNRDGAADVCAGPFWYEGPDFKKRHEYRPATASFTLKKADGSTEKIEGYEGALGKVNAYSADFLTFVYDFNADQRPDILVIGTPGSAASWYENPGNTNGHWTAHRVFDVVDNESPTFADMDGCGKPEIVCNSGGYLGYAKPNWKEPASPWVFHRISAKGKWHKYTHGIGLGDMNGDGRMDMLLAEGWREQPASLDGDPEWKAHPFAFADAGAQIYASDVNGDGMNDIITCVDAHKYGLVWWEQSRTNSESTFVRHLIMGSKPEETRGGMAFSQPHAIALTDIDGDGLPDIVAGKRFWAHGPTGDVEPNAPAVLYWFKLVRGPQPGSAEFVPHLVDNDSGVGMQVAVGDLNGDGKTNDLAISNKRGTFVFAQEKRK